jgi:hypothetical protein
MLVVLAAAAALASGPLDWCDNLNAPDKPRNVEDRQACAAQGVPVYLDRFIGYPGGPPTCENTAKHLSQDGAVDPPARIGDGYWVASLDVNAPVIRCHIAKIEGKTISMR